MADIQRILGKKKYRILYIWMSRSFCGLLLYRLERGLFLLFGKTYPIIRIPFSPILLLLQAYSNMDIHYKASIKGGLLILHPSLGCVISGQVIIGENLTLTGGNLIGLKKKCNKGEFVLGDNCNFGGNSTVIGPLIMGNKIKVGASACVVRSCINDNSVLIGVPAKELPSKV